MRTHVTEGDVARANFVGVAGPGVTVLLDTDQTARISIEKLLGGVQAVQSNPKRLGKGKPCFVLILAVQDGSRRDLISAKEITEAEYLRAPCARRGEEALARSA